MERRKIVHHICANVMGAEDVVLGCANVQAASSVTASFPAAAANVASMQTTLASLKSTLNSWYTSWRGPDPVEPADPAFLGAFGSVSSFTSKLNEADPMVRMVRNDYEVLGMLAMAYEEMYSIALALETDAPGLKLLALNSLKDLVSLIESVSETMCTVTIRDLHNQDSSIPLSLAADAVAATQAAWSP